MGSLPIHPKPPCRPLQKGLRTLFALQNHKALTLEDLQQIFESALRAAELLRLAKIIDLCKMLRKSFRPMVFCEGKAQTIGHFTGH